MGGGVRHRRGVKALLADLVERGEQAFRANQQTLIVFLAPFYAAHNDYRGEPRVLQLTPANQLGDFAR